MALTGQLSDMSLAELIEFFCNQRKTGRLKIDYQRGHSVFFIREGELVDAKVGSLSGVDAVYFSLTLPNAAFDFSPDVQASRRTINDKWTQVVLEGLRRLDEGLAPTEKDAFGGWSPTDADLAQMLDQVEHLDDSSKPRHNSNRNGAGAKNNGAKGSDAKGAALKSGAEEGSPSSNNAPSAEPFSMMMESANAGGGSSKKKLAFVAVAAAVLLACAAVAVPFMKRSGAGDAATAVSVAPQPSAPAAPEPSATSTEAASADNAEAPSTEAEAAGADDARRAALERERRERERRRKEEAKRDAASEDDAAKPLAPATPAPAGPKSVRVSVSYDEAGRVTQASVAGTTPGAEAYGSTAVRIARGRRFPAGKAGTTVVTIPVN
ncbi:MAG TPA: DUF4388 domain-containing protein [Pyrinomonadaceae bacterium]|nr:DUF4388 domain-containing protein [Pyrinomonadaceae bacterium]